jgi:hypothetical protein
VTDGLILALDAGNTKSYPGSGTTWTDLSGRGNNGTLVNGVGFDGGNGGSLSFDGVNDYVSTNLIYNLSSATTEFSCGCWFKCSSQSSNTLLISNYNGTPNPFNLYVNSNGSVGGFTRNASSQSISVFSTTTYDDNEYHNLFYQKDSNNNYYTYVDGILQNSGSANLGAINSNNTIWIGTLRLFNQAYFNGNIAQVSIYNRALTASEIQQNYNATKSRFQ